MSEKPKCKLCGARHWSNEPHKFGDVEAARKVAGITVVTPLVADGATPVMGRAEVVTSVIGPGEECPTCHRRMPSKAAVKQAAYRGRKA